uniref:Transposase n=2 Tax=Candidatus Kentrum sp. SD TaxID=2126332 RepID=A0A451BSI6_9GAMM|nr:MAG: hypothetical protein BECKSD772D_GA0070982_12602 [Candidatus Kentron sp. SD]
MKKVARMLRNHRRLLLNWFWAERRFSSGRHHTFFCLSELNTAIRRLLQEMNARPLQRQKVSRWDLFETFGPSGASSLAVYAL